MLVTSIFSISHNVFKKLLFLTRENQGLFGKGLTWNIEGLFNKLSSDIVSLLERFKIFALQETWITENFDFNFHFLNYVTYLCFARKSLLGGRASGGVAVFVENNVNSYIKRICSDFEYGVLLVIDKSLLE